jgi:uncharacterized protein (DUF1015 family)
LKKTKVKPFRGLRYNPEKITGLSDVVTPPYDVITPDVQRLYHEKSPFSSIRLELGIESEGDSEKDNRYTRSAALLEEWLNEGVLVPDEKPALYWCREEYRTPGGGNAVRDGFFAALELVEFSAGIVLPHEHTSPGPKADRLALMAETEANLSPIFCLYSDPDHEINTLVQERIAREADASASDEAGTKHSLWVIDDAELIEAVGTFMAARTLMIADGHHRYETALAYRDQERQREGNKAPHLRDLMMVYLSNTDNPGMAIFPLHRLISGLSAETISNLVARLETSFSVEEISSEAGMEELQRRMAEHGRTHNSFGMHVAATNSYYLLVANQAKPMLAAGEEGLSPAYRCLDAAVLDRVILADLLDIRPGGINEAVDVRFVERAEMSPEEFAQADHQVMILLNATTMDEVKAVSEAGEKMPKKSTYFYPKPVTGLVFRSFRI